MAEQALQVGFAHKGSGNHELDHCCIYSDSTNYTYMYALFHSSQLSFANRALAMQLRVQILVVRLASACQPMLAFSSMTGEARMQACKTLLRVWPAHSQSCGRDRWPDSGRLLPWL